MSATIHYLIAYQHTSEDDCEYNLSQNISGNIVSGNCSKAVSDVGWEEVCMVDVAFIQGET